MLSKKKILLEIERKIKALEKGIIEKNSTEDIVSFDASKAKISVYRDFRKEIKMGFYDTN